MSNLSRWIALVVALASICITSVLYTVTGGRWAALFHSDRIPLSRITEELDRQRIPYRVYEKRVYVKPAVLMEQRAEFSRSTYWTSPPESDLTADLQSTLPRLIGTRRVLMQQTDGLALLWVDGEMSQLEAEVLGQVVETLVKMRSSRYCVRVLNSRGHQLYQGLGGNMQSMSSDRYGAVCTSIPDRQDYRPGYYGVAPWCPGMVNQVGGRSRIFVFRSATQLPEDSKRLLKEIEDNGHHLAYHGEIPNLKGLRPGILMVEELRLLP